MPLLQWACVAVDKYLLCFAQPNKKESREDAVIWWARRTKWYSKPHLVCRCDSVLFGCTLDLLLEGEISGIFMTMHKPANVSSDGFLCRKKKDLQVLWHEITQNASKFLKSGSLSITWSRFWGSDTTVVTGNRCWSEMWLCHWK